MHIQVCTLMLVAIASSHADVKIKRNVYQQDDYQVRDVSQIDLTYRPDDARPSQTQSNVNLYPFNFNDAVRPKINEQSPAAQQYVPNYNVYNPQQNVYSPQQLKSLTDPVINQYGAPQYEGLQPKLNYFGNDKHIHYPGVIKTQEFADTLSPIPIIYGQPIKYIQQPLKNQFSPAFNTLSLATHQPANQYYQQYKVPQKILHRPQNQYQQAQVNTNPKNVRNNLYQPQTFNNPVVTQLQHFIPSVQGSFGHFSKPHAPIRVPPTSAPTTPPPPPPPPKKSTEEDDDRDDDDRRPKKEHRDDDDNSDRNEDDEEAFERGYEEAARGFHGYKSRDEDDDYPDRYSKHKLRHDEDDYEDDRRRPYDDDDRRGRYRDDHEGNYSEKHNKKESPKPKQHESKRHRDEEDDRPTKRPSKSYKSSYSTSHSTRKPQRDSRHAGSSSRKQTGKKADYQPKGAASKRSEREYRPDHQTVSNKGSKKHEDNEARHSSPAETVKTYQEGWQPIKTKA